MYRVLIVVAWAVLMVMLLYLWAEVRETGAVAKEIKRELLRNNLSSRASESFPNFREMEREELEREEPGRGGLGRDELRGEGSENEVQEGRGQERKALDLRTAVLNPSEERVLDEVLTEFLG